MGRRPLIIHAAEWQRLKSQANPNQPEPEEPPCKVDLQDMTDQSRKMMATWPDPVQGQVRKLSMVKKNKKARDMVIRDEYRNNTKNNKSVEAIKLAKEIIFERSSYGRQLISAIAESKALVEREVQIKFKQEMEEKEKQIENKKPKITNFMYAEFEKEDIKKVLLKEKEMENALFNKALAKMRTEDALQAAEIEKMHMKVDAKMIEKLRKLELNDQQKHPCLDKEEYLRCESETKRARERRAKIERQDDALAEVWSRYHDRIRCREQHVLDQIHKERHNMQRFKDTYEMIRKIQDVEEKNYNDFIQKGVVECEKRLRKKEKEEDLKMQHQRQLVMSEARSNKELGELQSAERANYPNKCFCDRTSYFRKAKGDIEPCNLPREERKPQFLPSNKLDSKLEALERRKLEPSSWTSTESAHAQFARAASAALAQCQHKSPVRKVIQNYRKQNHVQDLPISNY